MANELTLTVSGILVNGNLKETFNPGALKRDISAIGSYAPTVIVGTSEENLLIGDVSSAGYIFMLNLDASNFVTWGMSDSGTMKQIGKLKAGDVAVFRMDPAQTLRWKADTGPVKVKVLLLEN